MIPKIYKWIKVIKSNKYLKSGNAWYSRKDKIIYYNRNIFLKSDEQIISILEHEYAHYIFTEKVTFAYRILWKSISNFDNKIVKKINRLFDTNYKKNKYISKYAQKSYYEDFSECIEYNYLNSLLSVKREYKGYLWLKMKVAQLIFNKFSK